MGRPTDFGDKTIKKGFGPDKEKKLHVKEGQPLLVRIVTKLDEYLSHSIHDVLPPKRDAKTGANVPSIFNANCARAWDEKAEDYVGSCIYHDRDYDVTERYVGGVMILGMIQGKTVIPLGAAGCGRFWDMTAGRVAEIRKVIEDKYPEINDAAALAQKLRQTTLKLQLKDEGGSEMYQKLDIKVWEGQQLPITEEHKAAFKEEIPALLKEVAAPATLEEQERRLKKKANAPAPAAKNQAPEQEEDNLDDLDLDGGAAPAAAAPTTKPRATRAAPAKAAPAKAVAAAAPAEDDLDLGDDAPAPAEEVAEEPAPPAPAKKAAAAPAAKKAAVATATATKKASDAVVDDMLDGLENL
jgi:hypothetical protein